MLLARLAALAVPPSTALPSTCVPSHTGIVSLCVCQRERERERERGKVCIVCTSLVSVVVCRGGVWWVVCRGGVECLVRHAAAVECMVCRGGKTHKRPVMPRVEGMEAVCMSLTLECLLLDLQGIEALCTYRGGMHSEASTVEA